MTKGYVFLISKFCFFIFLFLNDISKSGRMKTSKNSLLHKINRNTDKNGANQLLLNSRNYSKASGDSVSIYSIKWLNLQENNEF